MRGFSACNTLSYRVFWGVASPSRRLATGAPGDFTKVLFFLVSRMSPRWQQGRAVATCRQLSRIPYSAHSAKRHVSLAPCPPRARSAPLMPARSPCRASGGVPVTARGASNRDGRQAVPGHRQHRPQPPRGSIAPRCWPCHCHRAPGVTPLQNQKGQHEPLLSLFRAQRLLQAGAACRASDRPPALQAPGWPAAAIPTAAR